MLEKKVRVLVVDDSILARKLIIDGLNAQPNIEVVGYAVNASDALKKVDRLRPDVMTCDVEMPGKTGIEFLKELLPKYPLPVVLVSSLNLSVFDALQAGAVDFVRKPDGVQNREGFLKALVQKVLVASNAKVRRPRATAQVDTTTFPKLGNISSQHIIALGASTGGTEATLEVMKRLPADIPGMVIVQHMPPGFTKMYADRLNKLCKMEVREAKSGDELHQGLALVAPADLQCRVVRAASGAYQVTCTRGEKVSGHRPSVDVLFQSVADNVRCKTIGIILTGMGADGAAGLLSMRQKGAWTIGQDEETSVVYGMPAMAYKSGAVCEQLPIESIAQALLRRIKM